MGDTKISDLLPLGLHGARTYFLPCSSRSVCHACQWSIAAADGPAPAGGLPVLPDGRGAHHLLPR